jgi:UDP-glucose 4-epimerase
VSSTRGNATLKRPSARALRGSAAGPSDAANGSTETAIRFESERPDVEKSAVVITGICGRMGQLLARQLHRDRQVIGIDRRRFDGKPEDIIHHQIDVRRRKTQDVFRSGNIGAVVHLGVMHNLRESDRTHHSWNVVGFQKLLEYVSTYKVPKLVVLSSAMLYGPSPDNPHFLNEDAPLLGAQEFHQIRDLIDVDMLAQSFFWKNPDVETVVLRPCHILGRVRNAASNYARMERPITVMGFDPMLQIIHERDVVAAITLALQRGSRGIYNLRGPGELPLSKLLRLLGKNPLPIPGPLINTVVAGLWNYRATNFPKEELDHLRYICLVDDRRARKELGFNPRFSIEETARAVLAQW